MSESEELSQTFAGKTVVVTGGSRGLGRSMCKAFSRRGANVVVASRKADACVELAEELVRTTGNPALGVGCHVGKWAECEQLVETVCDRFGAVDVLVNNAGVAPTYSTLTEVSEELLEKTFAVNLKGPFRLSALVGSRMEAGNGGSIINISSVASVEPRPNTIPYAAAKAALNVLTIGMARAFGPAVRVNGVMAGMFSTDISKAWDRDQLTKRISESIALGRIGNPDEIVGAVLYLASDCSSYTTGAIIKVDGGMAYGAR